MTAGPQPAPSRDARTVRVTLISTLPPHKGIADYTAHLARELAHQPSISLEVIDFASLYPKRLYPGGELQDASAKRSELPGVRVRTMLRWYNPLSWVWAGLTLRGDVVHAQWWSYVLAPTYVTVLSLARLRRKRVIVTVHNVEPHEGGWLRRRLNRLVFRLADGFIVHDIRSRDALAGMVAAGKPIAVVRHGVLSSTGEAPSKDDARSALGISGASNVILCFGNIRSYKGVDVLLRAFARVRQQVPAARLIIAGKPWEAWDRYASMISGLGLSDAVDAKLDFVPASEVGALFAAADVVVLPYLQFDAQSGVGARAVYHGRALVVTDVGGLPELVADPRAVVPPGDDVRLADALSEVLTDDALREKLEADSRARSQELSWDAIAEDTVRFYTTIRSRSQARVAPLAIVEDRPRKERV